jgi:RNA recognition motif-containing protein
LPLVGGISSSTGVDGSRVSYANVLRKKPVVRSRIESKSSIKASSVPEEFHLHLSNLDLETTAAEVRNYFKKNSIPVRILDCEIVHSKKFDKPRCLSAHVTNDARN